MKQLYFHGSTIEVPWKSPWSNCAFMIVPWASHGSNMEVARNSHGSLHGRLNKSAIGAPKMSSNKYLWINCASMEVSRSSYVRPYRRLCRSTVLPWKHYVSPIEVPIKPSRKNHGSTHGRRRFLTSPIEIAWCPDGIIHRSTMLPWNHHESLT